MFIERIQGEEDTPTLADFLYEEVVCDCEECSKGTGNKCQRPREHCPESDYYIYELAENPDSRNSQSHACPVTAKIEFSFS